MGMRDIRSALAVAYQGVYVDVPTVYENQDAVVGSDLWIRFRFRARQPKVSSLGEGGLDLVAGLLVLEHHYPIGTGYGDALEDVDRLRRVFVAGTRFEHNGQSVRIVACGVGAGKIDDGVYRVPVVIDWDAFLPRPPGPVVEDEGEDDDAP